jgi:hypothetical protein
MIAAACHIHSDWSYDGSWTLPALASEFGRQGWRVLLMTEHDRGFSEARRQEHRAACAAASSSRILVVPGLEYSDAENRVHVLVWGPVPFAGAGIPTADLLRAVKAAQGVAVLAHPSRLAAWQAFDPAWSEHLLGVEIWNRKTDGWAPSKTASSIAPGSGLVPFVGLDFHDRRQMFSLSMKLDLAAEVTEQSVLDCLRARRCQATAFGRPVEQAMGGATELALIRAERLRRMLARTWRWSQGKTG